MLTLIIKVLVGVALIGVGLIFIKYGDKQFGKYGPASSFFLIKGQGFLRSC